MDLLLNSYKLLKKIRGLRPDHFSGIGLVFYDESFDRNRHCDLRPGIKSPYYSISDDSICEYLGEISNCHHTLHDGFHMVNSDGLLTYVAQYFVPPVVKGLSPHQEHGVRLYSALCGSTLKGVLFMGIISSNYDIYMFKKGEYISIDELEERINHDYKR